MSTLSNRLRRLEKAVAEAQANGTEELTVEVRALLDAVYADADIDPFEEGTRWDGMTVREVMDWVYGPPLARRLDQE